MPFKTDFLFMIVDRTPKCVCSNSHNFAPPKTRMWFIMNSASIPPAFIFNESFLVISASFNATLPPHTSSPLLFFSIPKGQFPQRFSGSLFTLTTQTVPDSHLTVPTWTTARDVTPALLLPLF